MTPCPPNEADTVLCTCGLIRPADAPCPAGCDDDEPDDDDDKPPRDTGPPGDRAERKG